ncbi:MAG: hypothetical protein JKY66_10675 [Spongiibacteraceae bacterium]|nr:hypothetical protein [Spongiibacteraceae bacterium]
MDDGKMRKLMMNKSLLLVALLGVCVSYTPIVNAQDEEIVSPATDSARDSRRRKPGSRRALELDATPVESTGSQRGATQTTATPRRRSNAISPAEQQSRASTNPVSPVPRPKLSDYSEAVPMPDRWRIMDTLGYEENWYDPYHRNKLKGDKPIYGDDWFFSLGIISDTIVEVREVQTPVGTSSTNRAGGNDIFGSPDQVFVNQNIASEFVYFKGDTVFRPPDYEFRFTPVFNYNYLNLDEVQGVNVDPLNGIERDDATIGIQAAFADVHIRNVSDRYDFDSFRIGIQPFSSDFRGFLFQENQLGFRLFGNRDNNVFQYNISLFQRLEKDTNSGLNDISKSVRDDYVFAANVYWQDLYIKGFISQVTFVYNKVAEQGDTYFDANGFIARPASLGREVARDYDVAFIGYNGDGHFGRYNLTTSLYYAFGDVSNGTFVDQPLDVEAFFFAAEFSVDFDWIRPRISFLYGSGDDDPFDDKATGYDAIFENPQFAGSDTSYWQRQAVPLVGGGRVTISGRNSLLNSMRSSKELGQANFTNPGIILFGVGLDMDFMPNFRASINLNTVYFDNTAVLQVARNQGNIDEEIGQDVSLSLTYRPIMSQNLVFRASYAALIPGQGYDDLFPDDDAEYFQFNMVLAY